MRLRHAKWAGGLLWMVLLACSGRISPNKPDDNAGFRVVSSSPANNTSSVASGGPISISVTFSAAVDTATLGFLMAPLPATFDSNFRLGDGGRTVTAVATLQPNTSYTAVIYTAKSTTGQAFSSPFQVGFTTAGSFPTGRVQGVAQFQRGGSPASPKGTLVGLLKIDLGRVLALILGGQDPLEVLRQNLGALTVIGADDGSYALEHIQPGTYWPAAIKDVNSDGSLNPLGGDGLGYYDNPASANGSPGAEDSVRVALGQTISNINLLVVSASSPSKIVLD